VLAIARFDRQDNQLNQTNQHIAVEDFCSIAGFDPVNKYKGSLESIVTLHNEYVTALNKQESTKQLYKLILLSYALHNGDAHLKNFALRYTNYDDAVLTPVYDVVTTSAYPHLDDMPALTLQGKKAWWMGKQLRMLGATRLSLMKSDMDEAEMSIQRAIDETIPHITQMIERFAFFKDTGKRMIIEWSSGKLDITVGAKKRTSTKEDKTVLAELKLSDVETKKKKVDSHQKSTSSLAIKNK
jgi:serine/threonine-protein kinase HipA